MGDAPVFTLAAGQGIVYFILFAAGGRIRLSARLFQPNPNK